MKKILLITVIALCISSCHSNSAQPSAYKIDDMLSTIEWKGSATDHFHIGAFKVTGTLATGDNGSIKSGDFTIPISSIEDYDLHDPLRQTLLADLRENFFKIAFHPDAKFHLIKCIAYESSDTTEVSHANYLISGNFTMLGQTHSISFPTRIVSKGATLAAEAKFSIDRRKWGMDNYSNPSAHLYILPEVQIHLRIAATKQS
ncbi:MAG: YceI family protein [Agriterribacter sp.]